MVEHKADWTSTKNREETSVSGERKGVTYTCTLPSCSLSVLIIESQALHLLRRFHHPPKPVGPLVSPRVSATRAALSLSARQTWFNDDCA